MNGCMFLTKVNNKQILYENVRHSQDSILDTRIGYKWIGLIVANNEDLLIVNDVISKCLRNNISFVCCAGEAAEALEWRFDSQIVDMELENDDTSICTIYDSDFEEGVFSAVYSADIDNLIDTIICIDLTKCGVLEKLTHSLDKLHKGLF